MRVTIIQLLHFILLAAKMLHRLCKAGNCSEVEAYLTATQERDSEARVIQLANSKNDQKYTPLHSAIFSRNLELVKVLLKFGADVNIKCCGTPALHLSLFTAMLPEGKDFGLQCFDVLLQNSANVLLKDDNGFTPLHLAAEFNLHSLIPTIVEAAKPEPIVNVVYRLTGLSALHRAAYSNAEESVTALLAAGADVNLGDVYGMTPLHVAGYFACAKSWKALVSRGADVSVKDHSGNTPLDWLKQAGWQTTDKKHTSIARINNSSSSNGSSVTAIVSNPLCVQHHTCPPSSVESTSAPPENIKRLQVIVDSDSGVLRSKELENSLLWVENSREAVMSDVLRVHEWSYVRVVQQKCEAIESFDAEEEEGQGFLDGDTTICKNTFRAALAAAGAVCHAVDLVAGRSEGKPPVRNAFCPIRPPGHHAGPRGLVKLGGGGGPDSHGFCILNNISIGAAYAMNRYRETVKKVAIVDFDVHHGNGTEETVRWLRPGVDTLPLFSDFTFGQMHAPRYKPWFDEGDASNVLFVSVHGYGPRERGLPEHLMPAGAFYPGSGQTVLPDVSAAAAAAAAAATADAADAGANGGSSSSGFKAPKVKVVVTEGQEDDEKDDNDDDAMEEEDEEDSEEEKDFEPNEEEAAGESDEDDEDEEDGDYGEESSLPPSAAVALGGDEHQPSGSVLHPRVKALHRVYSTAGSSAAAAAAASGAVHDQAMKPLILDVGVALPAEDPSMDPLINVAGGKQISELKYRVQWRRYFREEIFPRLMTFKPDMIFISAGFDAHKKDTINSGYIALVEDDFEWVTDQLINIANSCCEGRVVSALEGGYQLGGEFSSAFAKSVKAHVTSLVHGGSRLAPYSQEQCDRDTETETKFIEKLEAVREEELARREALRAEREEQEERRLQELRQAMMMAEQQQQQSESSGGDAGAATAAAVTSETEIGDNSRKRRRPQVDYLALDKELRDKEGSGSAV